MEEKSQTGRALRPWNDGVAKCTRHTRVTRAYTHGHACPRTRHHRYGHDEKVCRDLEQGPVIQAEALDAVVLSLDLEVKQR